MRCPLAAWAFVLAGVLVAPGVRAQTCEQFRDTLAGRVDPGIRGFAMEIVPGSAPVPPQAKVFGTCEGGARKILFFRNGRPAESGEPVTVAPAAVAPSSAKSPAIKASAATASAAVVPPRPALPPASIARVASAPTARAVSKAVERPATPAVPEPVTAVASEAASWPALRSVTESASAASGGEPSPSNEPGLLRRVAPWLAGGVGLVMALLLWGWIAHRRAYDASGLPRGPRLKP